MSRARLRRRPGTPLVPLIFVMGTLVALVAVPLAAELYTRPIFEELRTVTAPAQQLLTRVHVTLALEGATLRDFADTRSPALASQYRALVRQDTVAQGRLGVYADRLGPDVRAAYRVLERAEREWHGAADNLLDGTIGDPAVAEDRRQRAYAEILAAAAHMDEALDDAVRVRRERIREAGQLQRRASVLLSALAILALAVVGWLARRLRVAAAAAEDGRRTVEELMESKARLVRGFSHDLKNPINAIDGHAALLADGVGGELNGAQRRHVERIRAGASDVVALVDDLLELSRADVGQLEVSRAPSDLRSVVLDAVDEHRGAAVAASQRLEARVPDDVPPVETDPHRVRQVLGNLLSNAIKYTPPDGAIEVVVEVPGQSHESSAPGTVAIHVADNGPGIPASQVDRVFDEFTRLDTTGRRGSGLGLAIARRVAVLLGGDLTVASEVGRGSTFTLQLPLNPQSADGSR